MNDAIPKSPLILIVDDDEALAESFGAILEMKGFESERVTTGEAGVARVILDPVPSLVIMDGNLPGMNGDESIREMRNSGFSGPVVAFSAETERGEEMRLAGAEIFFEKPVDMSVFLGAIEDFIKSSLEAPSS